MKTLLALVVLLAAVPAHADLESEFRARATEATIKPFALDLGGILGAASVDSGGRLGFPHFEAGVQSGLQFRPDRDNRILRDSGVKAFGIPLLYASLGLPVGFDVAAHGMKVHDATILGGGVRWSLFEAPLVGKAAPTAALGFWYDRLDHPTFDVNHYGFNASAGWALPIIHPFVNAGYDLTSLQVQDAAAAGVRGMKVWTRGSRFGAGVDLTPFPFLRLRAAYQLLHGIPGANLSLLAKF